MGKEQGRAHLGTGSWWEEHIEEHQMLQRCAYGKSQAQQGIACDKWDPIAIHVSQQSMVVHTLVEQASQKVWPQGYTCSVKPARSSRQMGHCPASAAACEASGGPVAAAAAALAAAAAADAGAPDSSITSSSRSWGPAAGASGGPVEPAAAVTVAAAASVEDFGARCMPGVFCIGAVAVPGVGGAGD